MNKTNNIKPISLLYSIILFGIPSIYFIIITQYLTTHLAADLLLHPALSWFISGLFVFIPLFILALVLYKLEGNKLEYKLVCQRFRLHKMSKKDWKWTLNSTLIIFILTGLIFLISHLLSKHFGISELKTTPGFMKFETLKGTEKLLLLAWLPMFFFNIVGEEILWRGYILPRQELSYKKYSWLINALLWSVFHITFGYELIILLIPILFIQPYITYKTKNTTTGIFIHAVINGPAFLLISLGIIK